MCVGMECAACLDYTPDDGESWCGYSDAGCELASMMKLDSTGVVFNSLLCPTAENALARQNKLLRKQQEALLNSLDAITEESQVGKRKRKKKKKNKKKKKKCTNPPEPTCEECEGACQGKSYVRITYPDEGQYSFLGCSYPKTYEYVDSCGSDEDNDGSDEDNDVDMCVGMECAACLDYTPDDGESWCGYSDAGCELASMMKLDSTGVVFSSSNCPIAERALARQNKILRKQHSALLNALDAITEESQVGGKKKKKPECKNPPQPTCKECEGACQGKSHVRITYPDVGQYSPLFGCSYPKTYEYVDSCESNVGTIYVGNLPYDASKEDLKSAFAEYGDVKKVQLPIDRESGRPRGFGFVEMESETEEERAIEGLNEAEYNGRTLKVNKARRRNPRQQETQVANDTENIYTGPFSVFGMDVSMAVSIFAFIGAITLVWYAARAFNKTCVSSEFTAIDQEVQ